jgi:1-acyl-sn-glycerol-3-phosphate acyltransferase
MHNAMDNNRRGLWLAYGLWFSYWLVLITIIISGLIVLTKPFDRHGTLGRRLASLWARGLLKTVKTPIQVEGLEHLVPGQTYVYAANHRSQFDIFVLLATLPGDFSWVAKKSLFQIPIFGQAMTRLGNISVDRTNLKDAIKSLNEAATLIRGGRSIIIFPEGTRAASRELLPFKKGVFIMAQKAGQPIVPISINGTMAIQPRGSLHLRPGPVQVVISPPVDPRDFRGRPKEELMAAVYQAIADHFDPDYPYGSDKPPSLG